jgi:hypothetical protein
MAAKGYEGKWVPPYEHPGGLVDAHEIVPDEIERQRVTVVIELL